MTALFSLLARGAIRRRWWFVVAWVGILLVAVVGAGRAEHALKVGGFSLPGTEFDTASRVLTRDLDISSDKTAIVVYHSDRLLATDRAFHDEVERTLAALRREPSVTKTETFYNTGIPDMVSRDNHTTYAWVTLEGSEEELQELTPRLRALARSDVVEVSLIGQAAVFYDTQRASVEDLVNVERFTFPIVFLLLVFVFGSLVAAAVPLALGLACVVVSLAALYLLTLVTDVSIFALNTASMIGLGLAIDFSLIMVSRFRQELARRPLEEALEATLQTAGRSITYSGVTLMLTMSVLTLFPVMIIRSIALAIVVVAAVSVLSGLLLLPTILVILAPYLDRLDLRRLLPFPRARAGRWQRLARAVMRRPVVSLVLALALLGALAAPTYFLQRKGATVEVLPETSESRRAYELMQRQFGPGEPAPIFVVVEAPDGNGLWKPAILEGVYDLHVYLQDDTRVAKVQSLATIIPNPSAQWIRSLSPATIKTNPDRERIAQRLADLDGTGQTTLLIVYPAQGETDPKTVGLLLDIRDFAKDWAPGLAGARVLVGGAPAQHYDFDRVVYDEFPLLLGLSLFVTFVMLMIFFHSLILPLKAILLNIVSLLASYGILVLVFQFGLGDRLLGFNSIGGLLSYTPVLLFSILFGLSTDYEVFLLTRVREYYRAGHSNEEAVALGMEQTAGVITAAGLIMIAVFGSFALTGVLVIKELGFGLAVAILIDTTLVRLVLVPATMKLMGRWNWWMPGWLARLVPEIDEGDPIEPPRKVAAAPTASAE